MKLVDTQFIDSQWEQSAIPELVEYTRIPNKSPAFDVDWEKNGYMDKVIDQFCRWSEAQEIKGLKIDVIRESGRTPLLFMEVPGQSEDTLLLYGHLDKQPEFTGWREGLGPWEPVIIGDNFYGRGVADDGYSLFAYLIAIKALQRQSLPHGRCVIIIEACEESGSYDLPFYMESLADRIGTPELVICLDASCGNYEQLWCTNALRGLLNGVLRIDILNEGAHSGDASGLVPSSFRILRQLLSRLEDPDSGQILPEFLQPEVPAYARDDADLVARALGEKIFNRFAFVEGARPASEDLTELVLRGTWKPTVSIIGVDGIPSMDQAGNILRPYTAVKLSIRLSPQTDAPDAAEKLKHLLESNPPYGAKVSFTPEEVASGWDAPPLKPALRDIVDKASLEYFGAHAAYMGDGGSIPFMDMLGKKFPQTQFVITGLLGPGSNAHGPNECMHIPTVKKLTAVVAQVMTKQFELSPSNQP